jgi:hypothetical protein
LPKCAVSRSDDGAFISDPIGVDAMLTVATSRDQGSLPSFRAEPRGDPDVQAVIVRVQELAVADLLDPVVLL